MLGMLIRARALSLVPFRNPRGGQVQILPFKYKNNPQKPEEKRKAGKKAQSLLQRGSLQAAPILILSQLMENHQALVSSKWHFIHWKCERCHRCPGLSSLSVELVRQRDAPSAVHARRVIDNNILRGEKAARLTGGN